MAKEFRASKTKIKRTHIAFDVIDDFCLRSKKLRNKTIWLQRQSYRNTGEHISFYTMITDMAKNDDVNYRSMPTKVSKETVKDVDESYKSFIKKRKKDAKTNPPRYSPKGDKGRAQVTFPRLAISKKAWNRGFIAPSSMGVEFLIPEYLRDTKYKDLAEVKFVPRGNHYEMIVVYKIEIKKEYHDTGRYVGIDFGQENYLTIVSNVFSPILFKSKHFLETNEYWLELKEYYKGMLQKGETSSKRLKAIDEKRNNKINHDLHCLTNRLIKHFTFLQISDVFIGWNKGIKNGINIGRNNNRKFVFLPLKKLIELLTYKCLEEGIKVHVINEAYTSLCSFVDDEEICFHEKYMGKRKGRLFRTKDGRIINADVNGAYNILRKGAGIKFSELDPAKVFRTPVSIRSPYYNFVAHRVSL